jgi:hypothetical protein
MGLFSALLDGIFMHAVRKEIDKDTKFQERIQAYDKELDRLAVEMAKDFLALSWTPSKRKRKDTSERIARYVNDETAELIKRLTDQLGLTEKQREKMLVPCQNYARVHGDLIECFVNCRGDATSIASQIVAARKVRDQNIENMLTSSQRATYRRLSNSA